MNIRLYAAIVVIGVMTALPPAKAAESLADIREQQTQLRDDLAKGERVLEADKRRTVDEQQRIVFGLIDGKRDVDELNPIQRMDLKNALEVIKAALSQTSTAEEDREVCWQEKRTGTKLVTTVCGTVRERQQAKEGARDFMQRPRICAPPGCGASP